VGDHRDPKEDRRDPKGDRRDPDRDHRIREAITMTWRGELKTLIGETL